MPRTVAPVVPSGSLRDGTQPELTTANGLRLRPWLADDAGDIAAVLAAFGDPQIQQWSARVIGEADDARVWMAGWASTREAETGVCWALERRGAVVGRVALRDIDLFAGLGQLAYWVLPSARGGGVASGAVAEVTRWAFELGLHRLELCHSVVNAGSCGVAQRCGFLLEGILRDGMLHADGWHDMHLHARIAPHR